MNKAGIYRPLQHPAFLLFLLLLALALAVSRNSRGPFTMTASWYGPTFQGKITASGEPFDMYAMTAAHKSLPLGTVLKVTWPKTGKSAVVTINDRGPYVWGRDLDLSYAAAEQLGCVQEGVVRVKAEWIRHDSRYDRHLRTEPNPASGATLQAP
ncbi:MAG: septal ring lytic transglycosylase RlpA family protein [Methylacidiphilales bacterium]|nr:septal ring lytic transglycosylase RlpA family protein [Candidatus Methylacidiphilales bacterium]